MIINEVRYVGEDSIQAQPKLGPEVIIRTYSAGVHIGTIVERDGGEVVLSNARRLYSWSGAFTLNAVSLSGVDRKNSRISKPVNEIRLQWIEILPIVEGVDLSTTEK
jgi:hypothetical protein